MSRTELREQWRRGDVDRDSYLQLLRDKHRDLDDYADFIRDTDIASITVSGGAVILESRWAPARFLCDFNDLRSAPLVALALGEYEALEMRTLLSLLTRSSTLVDVGANIGWYSIHAAVLHPGLRVVALEPVARTYEVLERNASLNGVSLEACRAGLSDARGKATIQVSATRSDAASLHPSRDYSGSTGEDITLTTLDALAADLRLTVDVVKADVEGAELMVLRGGRATLERDHPAVLAEMLRLHSAPFGYHPNDIIELMRGLGYLCFASAGRGWEAFITMTDATTETNFLFLHGERHAEVVAAIRDGSFPSWPEPRVRNTTPGA